MGNGEIISDYEFIVVGGGIAGLSFAIRLKQINPELSVCVIEKGATIGSHLLSGAVLETKALDELITDWRSIKSFADILNIPAKNHSLRFLTKKKSWYFPLPPQMNSGKDSFVISICRFAKALAEYAENLGVDLFTGFSAYKALFNENSDTVTGVKAKGEGGIKASIIGKYTIIAEGCHGSIAKQLIEKFDLRSNSSPQTYGLGIKEVWEIKPENHNPGKVSHFIGYPYSADTYGGAFLYHMNDNLISIGTVIGLDYKNPYISPFHEMQRFKLHPDIRTILDGGKRIAYGAKTLTEGGWQSLPKLIFNGGLIIGDSAGFLNVPKIKGIHTAMKSAMIAAEAVSENNSTEKHQNLCIEYPEKLQKSWLWKELKSVRNIRPAFRYGLWIGLVNAGFETVTFGLAPWTLPNKSDHESIKKASDFKPISYPEADSVLTFDILSSIYLSNITHEHEQENHLILKNPDIPITKNLPDYDEPAQRYCPAQVYEVITDEKGKKKFRINSENCIHCKTCDIKDPSQNIEWKNPWGGSGPSYSEM